MSDPLISVIIPAYNCQQFIRKAIDSALAQQMPVEILVINDGSADRLDDVMAHYRGNPAVIYLKNERNLGVAQTRNRGVSLAKGKYVAFLDADDYWAQGKLRKQVDAMEENQVVLCATARELLTPEGKPTGRIIPVKKRISYRDLLKHNSINCSSVLMRTEVAREFPMHHEQSHEDYIMWMEILRKYHMACGINEPLLKYRLSRSGKSGNKLNSARMTYTAYRYSGLGVPMSLYCFCSYAIHGIWKYSAAALKRK